MLLLGLIGLTMLTRITSIDWPPVVQTLFQYLPTVAFAELLIALLLRAGGFAAFSEFLRKRVRSASGVLMGTWVFGLLLFVDDYMNSLAAGTAMRDLSDEHGVSREKLAYVVDSTAAPVSVIIPFSTWSAFYTGLIVSSGLAAAGEGFGLDDRDVNLVLVENMGAASALAPTLGLGVLVVF